MEYLYNKYYAKIVDLSKITYLTIRSSTYKELIPNLPLMINLKKIFLEVNSILEIPDTFIKNIKKLQFETLEIIGTCSLSDERKYKKLTNEQQHKILFPIQEEELLPEIEIKRKELYNPDEQKLIGLLNNLPTSLTDLHFECIPINYDDILNAIDNAVNLKPFKFNANECGLSIPQVEHINKLISK